MNTIGILTPKPQVGSDLKASLKQAIADHAAAAAEREKDVQARLRALEAEQRDLTEVRRIVSASGA